MIERLLMPSPIPLMEKRSRVQVKMGPSGFGMPSLGHRSSPLLAVLEGCQRYGIGYGRYFLMLKLPLLKILEDFYRI